MLTIIKIQANAKGRHDIQSQQDRSECWEEGWIAVPEALEAQVWACRGYCELEIQDGVLTGVTPTEEELEELRKQQLKAAKTEKIKQSNDLLEEFLATHPITWVDGQQYSVTEEKQGLLTSNIALYQLSVQAGKPRELKWNTTGDVCTVWTIENLSALALAIGDYVQPYVTYQQTVEVQIKECTTMEELEAIVIDYSTVSTVEPEVLTGE